MLLNISLTIFAVDSKIFFAGREWFVKDRTEPAGPGGNYWSPNNVWVDGNGNLHLTISYTNGQWRCAEIYAVEHTSYGEHKYYITGRPDIQDKNVVLGMFSYKYFDDENVREMDIEFTKWGNSQSTTNTNFAIHKDDSGNPIYEKHFASNLNSVGSVTAYYNWTQDDVFFRVNKGFDGELIEPDSYKNQTLAPLNTYPYNPVYVPQETDYLKMHINYWLFQGRAPLSQPAEMIINNVLYPPVHYDANYNFNTDKTIKLREAICNSTINSGRNIAFEISQSIELGPGFEVKAGGTLSINASSSPQMVKRNYDQLGNNTKEAIVVEPMQENAVLYQNYPNPFSNYTTIPLYIPENVNSTRLIISDMFGRQIKSVEIGNRGNVPVEFQTLQLSNGLYFYSLYIDGKLIGSNKMILKK